MKKKYHFTNGASVLIALIFLSFGSSGCKKERVSQSEFGSCLVNVKMETLTNMNGALVYTNQINGLYFSTDETKYSYVIYPSKPRLPLVICNFPSSIILEKNESREVIFSGKAEIASDLVDVFATDFELWKLEFSE